LVTYQNYTKMHGQKNIKIGAGLVFPSILKEHNAFESLWHINCSKTFKLSVTHLFLHTVHNIYVSTILQAP